MVDLLEYTSWARDDSDDKDAPALAGVLGSGDPGSASAGSLFGLESLEVDNPFGTNGIFARLGEKIPIVNAGLQRVHELSGDEEALIRARRENPIGPDGFLTQVAEHIPLLNSVVQEVFRTIGEDQALLRARERDPIGTHGYLTKAFEHIPVISDGVMVLHKLQGEDDAYERARAHSLQNLLSKDGAITRFAELMPVSNLLAAAVHEVNGNHEEAIRALDLLESWAQAFKPDSPFARVAELIPGPDALAFALHMQGGYYAQALRSLTKTAWVNVSADKVVLIIACSSLSNILCTTLEAHNIAVQPRQFSLLVGVRDVLTNFLIVDKAGHRRVLRANIQLQQLGAGLGAFELTKELLKSMVNEKTTKQISRFMENLPGHLNWLLGVINDRMPNWRAQSLFMRTAFPAALPPLRRQLVLAIQQALPRAKLVHGLLPDVRPVRLHRWQHRGLTVQSTSAVGCFSLLGGCSMGAKAGGLFCAAGLACGAVQLGRSLVRRTARWLDDWNSVSWADVVEEPQPSWSWRARQEGVCPPAVATDGASGGLGAGGAGGGSSSSSSSATATTTAGCSQQPPQRSRSGVLPPAGWVLELLPEDAARLGGLVRAYYMNDYLGGRLGSRVLEAAEPALRALARTVMETQDAVVPFVLEVDLDAWEIELAGYSFNLWMPSMRFAVVLHLDMAGGAPRTSRVFLALPDELLDNVVRGLQEQIPEWDLRELDPRFSGFQKPAHLDFRLGLRWRGDEEFELEATSMRSRLDLPW